MTSLCPKEGYPELLQAWEDRERVGVFGGHEGPLVFQEPVQSQWIEEDPESACRSYAPPGHFCAVLGRLAECPSCTLQLAINE